MNEVAALPPLRTVLVTGAGGFIGRALCPLLQAQGMRVRALLRTPRPGPWDEAVVADLAAPGPLDQAAAGVEGIFHLAGLAHTRPTAAALPLYHQINVLGTQRLLEAAARQGVARLVLVSSVKAMGEGGYDPEDETTPPRPVTPYGLSKRAAEELVLAAPLSQVVVVRLPLVYGPQLVGNLDLMVRAVQRHLFPPPPDIGNRRAMVQVTDTAQALLLAAHTPAAHRQVFLLTDGQPYSTRRVYEGIVRALGRTPPGWAVPYPLWQGLARVGDQLGRIPFNSDALDKLLGSAWYDNRKARQVLGFEPRYTWETALPEILKG